MYIKKIFIPGEFNDAYIYMYNLIVFTDDGFLFSVNIELLANYIEQISAYPINSVAQYIFSKGTWIKEFPLVRPNSVALKEFKYSFLNFPDFVEIKSNILNPISNTKIKDILYTTVYNRRVYLGSESGVYHLDLDWRGKYIESNKKAKKRFDAMCIHIKAGSGAVNISCGDDGLITQFDDFNQFGNNFWRNHEQQYHDNKTKSIRTGWFQDNLINYTAQNEIDILKVKRDKQMINSTPRTLAIGFDNTSDEIFDIHSMDKYKALYLYNTSRAFIMQTENKEIVYLDTYKSRDTDNISVKQSFTYQSRLNEQIISIQPINDYFIMEYYDSVKLLARNSLVELVEGKALSIKTYPKAKLYKNLVTIVTEEGIYIISIIDENDFLVKDDNNYDYFDENNSVFSEDINDFFEFE